jgi:hypothetical protein
MTFQNLRNIFPVGQKTQTPVIPFQRENKPPAPLNG